MIMELQMIMNLREASISLGPYQCEERDDKDRVPILVKEEANTTLMIISKLIQRHKV